MKKLLVILLLPTILLAQKKTTPANALQKYLSNGDNNYSYELKDSGKIGNTKTYQLLLTSQKWRGITWRHQLTVMIPSKLQHKGSLLIISGGGNTNEQPNWSTRDGLWTPAAQMAETNRSIVAILKQTPNQPLMEGRKEDGLISYTLQQYKNDGDYEWPLLFPMVKSAIRSMDAIQDFAAKRSTLPVEEFLVAGASKRGWTTWLTAAAGDKRVKAIAPMVIDMLNMSVSLNAQLKAYGGYSEQIEDYVKLEIPQSTGSKKGKEVTTMIDPFSYKEKLTVPKLIFIGTNDEYWTVDAIKWYINDLPGQTMIHYVPNAGHDLGGGVQALQTLNAFYGKMLQNKSYPILKNNSRVENGKLKLLVSANTDELQEVSLWSSNSTDMDFRKEKWSAQSIGKGTAENQIEVDLPKEGYKAFYVDFKYKGAEGPYISSTRMYLLSSKGLE
ncbi:MAG: PhoPQ-activated pathogenicity-related family protein [Chitinophagia bacterium]|jgi:PhoPQ-activated pathogenicity-related protein